MKTQRRIIPGSSQFRDISRTIGECTATGGPAQIQMRVMRGTVR
jgi:hypothetical protein